MILFTSRKKIETEIAKRAAEMTEHIMSETGADIHDDLIQKLSIFRLHIDRIERSANDADEIRSIAIKMRNDFDLVSAAIKGVSRRLLPERIEGDSLEKTVLGLCQTMEKAGTAHIHFENVGTPSPTDIRIDIHILRIVQELIHNALKHSAAWHIWVRLHWTVNELVIEVEDDGSGFSKIQQFITILKQKNNSLKMRTLAIEALIEYAHGKNGLLVKVRLPHNKP